MVSSEPIKETTVLPVPNLVEKSYDSPAKFPDITSNVSASNLIAQMVTPIMSVPAESASTPADPKE